MVKSFLAVTLQEIRKQPGFSAVKILSLAIGLACSILVLMHVQYAFNYDRHFPNAEKIYRVVTDFRDGADPVSSMVSSAAWEPQLRLDYPHIVRSANARAGYGLFSRGDIASGNAFAWVDPAFVAMFSLEFISGDPDSALTQPNGIVLTETTAAKYFPGEDPLGKTLTFDGQADLEVTGVIRDLPENTHFNLPMLASVETGKSVFGGGDWMSDDDWYQFNGTVTYLQFADARDAEVVNADLTNFLDRHQPPADNSSTRIDELRLSLEPMTDAYLSERGVFRGYNPRTQVFGYSDSPRAQVLVGLGLFALLILLTSSINFASLSLAQIQDRGKEIGLRKTLGANRLEIIGQFLIEAVMLAFVALVVALPAVWLCLPVYTAFTDTGFTFTGSLGAGMLTEIVLFTVVTGVLSGLLPALFLSRHKPAVVIKGKIPQTRVSHWARFAITAIQFTLSTSLIMMALAVVLQIRHLNDMDIGFNRNNLVVFDSSYNWFEPDAFNYEALVNELGRHPGVTAVGLSNAPLPYTAVGGEWRLAEASPDQYLASGSYIVDDHYIDALQIDLVAGRNFSEDLPGELRPQAPDAVFPPPNEAPLYAILITRSTTQRFGFERPQDAVDAIVVSRFGYRYRVIGVIEDFQTTGGLDDPGLSPGILSGSLDPLTYIFVRLAPGQTDAALAHIDGVWQTHRPGVPINRSFYDQTYRDLVEARTQGISKAATFASVVTVLISTFGIYALAYYSGQRRTREVGIRKVLGATSTSIVMLLTWDLLKPVIIAVLIAWDASNEMIDAYLEQFSSRVAISPLLFLALALATLVLVSVTSAVQTFRTANTRPVESLRYE